MPARTRTDFHFVDGLVIGVRADDVAAHSNLREGVINMHDAKRLDSNSIDVSNQEEGNPSEDKIRMLAYYIYSERGRRSGDAVTDWLEAEAEILRSKLK